MVGEDNGLRLNPFFAIFNHAFGQIGGDFVAGLALKVCIHQSINDTEDPWKGSRWSGELVDNLEIEAPLTLVPKER